MIDKKTFTAGVLTITAVIILAALLVVQALAPNLVVADVTERGGNYIMTSGSITNSTEEIFVIDIATGRMNLYRLDLNRNRIIIDDRVNLDQMFRDQR